jgi:hypothetical protein
MTSVRSSFPDRLALAEVVLYSTGLTELIRRVWTA